MGCTATVNKTDYYSQPYFEDLQNMSVTPEKKEIFQNAIFLGFHLSVNYIIEAFVILSIVLTVLLIWVMDISMSVNVPCSTAIL